MFVLSEVYDAWFDVCFSTYLRRYLRNTLRMWQVQYVTDFGYSIGEDVTGTKGFDMACGPDLPAGSCDYEASEISWRHASFFDTGGQRSCGFKH